MLAGLGDPNDYGPVVYWRPFDGQRHALHPHPPPRDGQQRETLCGLTTTLAAPTDIDWLDPTCQECWTRAKALLDERLARRRARERGRNADCDPGAAPG